jgi:glutathione S-transferase
VGKGWLLGPQSCLADWALLPFVRQFRIADPAGFDATVGIGALQAWLARFEAGGELAAVMAPPLAPRHPWRSPSWLYHLALAEEWRDAEVEGVYRRSTRGLSIEQVGYLHASHGDQIAATFERFYADAGPVRLLSIDPQRLAAAGLEVREEAAPDSGELFPHLYGGPLPCEAVVAAEPYRP